MKAIVYTRVSSDPRQQGRSVTEQEAECRAVADRAGWTITTVLTDNDRSASRYARKNRPAFDELQELIRAGGVEVLVTWEASRFQRDLDAYVQLREMCRKQGVLWSYSGRTYDLARTDDRMATGLDALLAERESDMTSERVRRAVRANAVNGRPHGRNGFGYTRVYDPETRELKQVIVNQAHAEILHEIRRRFMAGESFYEIARDLTARNVPRPIGDSISPMGERATNDWWASNLARLMRNPAYLGKRTHKGEIVGDAIWPAIFTEDAWWPMQALLTDPARFTHRHSAGLRHLLTGIAVCGQPGCGARVKLVKNRGNPSYICAAAFHVSRKQADVDEVVTALLLERLKRPDAIQKIAERHVPDTNTDRGQLATLRARLDAFCDSAAAGTISPAALARIEAKLSAEIRTLEARIQRTALPPVFQRLAGVDIPNTWLDLPVRDRRDLVDALMVIRILPVGTGRRAFDPDSIDVSWRD